MPLAGQLTSRRGEEGARGFGYNNNNNKRCYSNEGTLKCFALFKCSLDLRCVASQTTRGSMNSSSKKCTDTNIKCVCVCVSSLKAVIIDVTRKYVRVRTTQSPSARVVVVDVVVESSRRTSSSIQLTKQKP